MIILRSTKSPDIKKRRLFQSLHSIIYARLSATLPTYQLFMSLVSIFFEKLDSSVIGWVKSELFTDYIRWSYITYTQLMKRRYFNGVFSVQDTFKLVIVLYYGMVYLIYKFASLIYGVDIVLWLK